MDHSGVELHPETVMVGFTVEELAQVAGPLADRRGSGDVTATETRPVVRSQVEPRLVERRRDVLRGTAPSPSPSLDRARRRAWRWSQRSSGARLVAAGRRRHRSR